MRRFYGAYLFSKSANSIFEGWIIVEYKKSYSVIGFCNVSLFTNFSVDLLEFFIEKTTFEEFVEIWEQIHRKL